MDNSLTILYLVLAIAFAVFEIASVWKTFEKAGKPGWAVIVPIYNYIVMLEIARKPGWWFFLLLIPIVNLMIVLIVCTEMARHFGKGIGFGFGLLFLGFIFFPILGFGDAEYQPEPVEE